MNVKFLDLQKQNKGIKKELMSEISDIIDSCAFVSGKRVRQFEESFAEYCDVKYCVTTSSGTAALHAALYCYDYKGEVLTTPNSFIATSEAISYCPKFKHKFVDVNATCNMDFEKAVKAANSKTRVILPTSLYGNPCDLLGLKIIANQTNSILINDAAQAHGAYFNKKPMSHLAALTCFSFYPGKNLGTCGEGGAVVTNSKRLYEIMKCFINHGQSRKYTHEIVGCNHRMSEIEAAALNIKLPLLEEWTEKRIEVAHRYRLNLSENPKIKMMEVKEGNRCVYHIFPVFIKNRNRIQEDLLSHGIQTGLHYPKPIHLQKAYKNLGYGRGDFPVAEKQASTELSLPMYPELTKRQIDYVCKKLEEVI